MDITITQILEQKGEMKKGNHKFGDADWFDTKFSKKYN